MKRLFLLSIISFFTLKSYSQITFEKGYFINNSEERINCLIKNIDWKNNPSEFEYKLLGNDNVKKATIQTVMEFGINNTSKYIRRVVDIDTSSDILDEISSVKNPIFKKEKLFLKVLVEGNANLYLYEKGNLMRYFFNKEESEIKQLIFKIYETKKNKIGQNNGYKQQLFVNLECRDISIKDVERLHYRKKDLISFFVKYNECNNSEVINFEEKQNRDSFNLTLRAGINNSSLSIQNSLTRSRNTKFGSNIALRLGAEIEYILPFNKNKWSISIEPTYQSFRSEKEMVTNENTAIESKSYVKADYNSLEFPLTLRYYLFLNNNSKIFLNGSFIVDLNDNSKIDFESGADLEINTRSNFGFGLGYKYDNKYSVEIRYLTSREILSDYIYWSSDYSTLSLIFGYSIF